MPLGSLGTLKDRALAAATAAEAAALAARDAQRATSALELIAAFGASLNTDLPANKVDPAGEFGAQTLLAQVTFMVLKPGAPLQVFVDGREPVDIPDLATLGKLAKEGRLWPPQ